MLTLGDIVRLNGTRVGKDVAVVWRDTRVTHEQLDLRSNIIGNAILDMGIGKGDRVALLASNCHQIVDIHVACSKVGAILVPLNAMLHPMEITRLLNHCQAKVIFVTSDFTRTVDSIRAETPDLKGFISIGEAEGMINYEEILSAYPNKDPIVQVDENDTALISYTSGTTGLPKGVMISHRNLFSNAINAVIGYNIPLGGKELIPFPLFFSAIFNAHVIPHLLAEGTVVILDWFKPELFIDAINREKPNVTLVNPTMLHDFISHPRFKECDLSSLKLFLVGAAPISLARFQEARQALGSIPLIQGYGLTECVAFVTCMRSEDYSIDDPVKLSKRLTSVGKPGPTLQVKIIKESGIEVTRDGNEIGELIIKGPSVMQGYWRRPEATSATIKEGWLYTGDLATIDEAGYIRIVGRIKDMIVSGGINVYPEEIENVLYNMPGVHEVAVVGCPDERWGESVAAIIVTDHSTMVTEEGVIQYCKQRLASYKKPTKVIFTEQLPRNPSGKVKKTELRERLAKGQLD